MNASPIEEVQRWSVLRTYHILDTVPDQDFDELTRLAALLCEVPMALLCFADAERHWPKASTGIDLSLLPRDCTFPLLTAHGMPVIIPNALEHDQVAQHPLVVGALGVRFLAAVPITDPIGYVLGELCVLDQVPRNLTSQQHEALCLLSRQVSARLEQHRVQETLQQALAEKAEAEAVLARERDLLQALMDNIPDTIYFKDTSSRFTRVNRAQAALMGVNDPQQVVGKSDFNFQDAKLSASFYAEEQALLRSGQPLIDRVEYNPTPDGKPRWFSSTKAPIRAADGRMTGIVGISRDITARIQSEQTLADNERRYRLLAIAAERQAQELALLDQVRTALARELDLTDVFRTIVEAIAATFGYTQVSLYMCEGSHLVMQHQVGYRFFIERIPLNKGVMGRCVRTAKPILLQDVKADSEFLGAIEGIVSEICVPLYDRGAVVGVLNVESTQGIILTEADLRLMTALSDHATIAIERARLHGDVRRTLHETLQLNAELSAAREAALEAAQLKSDFLAMMSHEIRTPLNSVIGMTSLLFGTRLSSEQRDFAETIRRSGEALLTVINDILDFSKIESDKLELEQQPFDVCACVEDVLDLVSAHAAEKNLNLAYIIDESTPQFFFGDDARLRQILVNLVSNGIKFTERGEVVVTMSAALKVEAARATPSSGDISAPLYELHFAVRDTGIGIPADRMNRLFQSFTQVNSFTSRQYGGTGLGLVISKRLAELMGGTIWVESAIDDGSTFHFTIQAPLAPTQRAAPAAHATLLRGKKALLIEGNATNRQILTCRLGAWGMEIHTMNSVAEALRHIEQGEQFDVGILDMHMPEIDGLALAASLRAQAPTREIPLVLLTAISNREIKRFAEQLGCAVALSKPIKPQQLHAVLLGFLYPQYQQGPVVSSLPGERGLHAASSLRILLVEDNLVNQKVALSMLQRLGYRADLAANGLEALNAAARYPYDIVLMDVQMPELDGLEATRRLRTVEKPEHRAWIIAMTANALRGDRERCIEAGMDDYISKPVQIEDLSAALTRAAPSTPATDAPEDDDKLPIALDMQWLERLQSDLGPSDPTIVSYLIDLFLQDAPQLIAQMRMAAASGALPALERAAHTLKTSSAYLGAVGLTDLCQQLERLGKSGTLEGTEALAAEAAATFERTAEALRRIRDSA